MTEPGFWDDQDNAQQVIDEMNGLKKTVQELDKLSEELENLDVSYELIKEENDQELFDDLHESIQHFSKELDSFELEILLSEPYDKNNAILEVH